MPRLATSYIPHALYGLAIISISIHLVSKRKAFETEKASLNGRITILESIAEQLRSGEGNNKPQLADDELERLKKLVTPPVKTSQSRSEGISWKEVLFSQRRQPQQPDSVENVQQTNKS